MKDNDVDWMVEAAARMLPVQAESERVPLAFRQIPKVWRGLVTIYNGHFAVPYAWMFPLGSTLDWSPRERHLRPEEGRRAL